MQGIAEATLIERLKDGTRKKNNGKMSKQIASSVPKEDTTIDTTPCARDIAKAVDNELEEDSSPKLTRARTSKQEPFAHGT